MLSVFSPAERPLDELDRQRAVDDSGLLQSPPDPSLHALVDAAARLFDAPMAALSVVDREREWLAARTGWLLPAVPRTASFTAHAILMPDDVFVVRDAAQDERFAGNPIVQSAPHVRFYAGAVVRGRRGHPLGALCVLDHAPRHGMLPLDALQDLALRAARMITRGMQ